MPPEKLDRAAGELGAGEQHDPARESRAGEVAAVEDHAGEVEVQALPGHRRPGTQVGADEPDDGVAHLPVRPVSGPFGWGGVLARVRVVGQAQVGAQHVDAGLPVLLPVIGEPRHGVHAGQPDRWLGVAELGCDRGEPLVEDPGPVMSGVGLGDLLPPVGHDQRD